MIVSGYTLYRNSSMANPDRREWVPTPLCENTSLSFPKEGVPDLRYLSFIWEGIDVLWCSTQTVFSSVSRVVPGYEFSMMSISNQMPTGQRFLAVCNCVTVVFLTPFFCVRDVGYALSDRWKIPLSCGGSAYVFLYSLVLVRGKHYLLPVLYRMLVCL